MKYCLIASNSNGLGPVGSQKRLNRISRLRTIGSKNGTRNYSYSRLSYKISSNKIDCTNKKRLRAPNSF